MSAVTTPKPKDRRLSAFVEKATLHDVSGIYSVLQANRKDPGLLQRPRIEIQRNLRDYMIATDDDGRLLGCVALQFHTPKIAEIWQLAVNQTYHGKGIGAMLMQAARQAAEEQNVEQLFLRTTNPEYFERHGYTIVSKYKLPKSILFTHFKQTFQQPLSRWLPNLFGRFCYMERVRK